MKCKVIAGADNAAKLEAVINDWLSNNSKIQIKHVVAIGEWAAGWIFIFYEE